MMRSLYGLLLAAVFLSSSLFAAEILKVKGSNSLVNLQGEAAAVGDTYFAMSGGKKRAIVRILKIKGDKAIARILKGHAAAGMTLMVRNTSSPGTAHASSGSGVVKSRSYLGGMLGFSMDTMKVSVNSFFPPNNSIGTANLKGNSFSAMGLFDYEMFPQIWFRGLGGIEGFSVTGTSMCGTNNAETCNATIYYLGGDFIGRYVFSEGNIRPWLGGGVELMFPLSKSASALNSSSIGTTNLIQFAGGVDWFVNPRMYVPISLEYGMFPKSNEVEATEIELRGGLAFPY